MHNLLRKDKLEKDGNFAFAITTRSMKANLKRIDFYRCFRSLEKKWFEMNSIASLSLATDDFHHHMLTCPSLVTEITQLDEVHDNFEKDIEFLSILQFGLRHVSVYGSVSKK